MNNEIDTRFDRCSFSFINVKTICLVFIVFCSAVLISFSSYLYAEDYEQQFSDTPSSYWAVTEGWIPYATSNDLMSGYKNANGELIGLFGPEDLITRGQVAAILFRIANPNSKATTDPSEYETDTGFNDQGSQLYYRAAIKWLLQNGITTGDKAPDGSLLHTFRPDDPVERQELAAFAYRFCAVLKADLTVEGQTALDSAPDASLVYPYARNAMAWAASRGAITGSNAPSNKGYLAPNSPTTRAQASKVFSIVNGLVGTKGAKWGVIKKGYTKQIVDKPAWTETITNGWKSSDGAIFKTYEEAFDHQQKISIQHVVKTVHHDPVFVDRSYRYASKWTAWDSNDVESEYDTETVAYDHGVISIGGWTQVDWKEQASIAWDESFTVYKLLDGKEYATERAAKAHLSTEEIYNSLSQATETVEHPATYKDIFVPPVYGWL